MPRKIDKKESKSSNPFKTFVGIVVTVVWAYTVLRSIMNPAVSVDTEVHIIMGVITGALFKDTGFDVINIFKPNKE